MTLGASDTLDKYQIISKVYQGPFSEVYHAYDTLVGAERAIKILYINKPEEVVRHINEAHISYKCTDPYIVNITDANVYGIDSRQAVVIAMEWLPEGSINSQLKDRFISSHEAVKYIEHALRGLRFAHSQEIIHGDIKPANIMLRAGAAKLSDFGLAVDGASDFGPEKAGYAYMTHMAPELFDEDSSGNVFTDIFAMGSTLFRICNNIFEWNELVEGIKNYERYLEQGKIIGKKIPYEPFVSKKLKVIINKACNPDSTKRYQSAAEMKQALDNLVPNIEWIRENDTSWDGKNGDNIYEIEIVKGRKWKVEVKCNGRRKKGDCKIFSTYQEADDYLNKYIAETTFS